MTPRLTRTNYHNDFYSTGLTGVTGPTGPTGPTENEIDKKVNQDIHNEHDDMIERTNNIDNVIKSTDDTFPENLLYCEIKQ